MPHSQTSRTNSEQLRNGGLRCLVLGVFGSGMTAAAELLLDAQHTVFGIDERLKDAAPMSAVNGVRVLSPDGEFPPDLDICVASPAFDLSHPLIEQLVEADVEVIRLPEFLARVFYGHRQICVAGTHGKSTTAAMIAWILDDAGLKPSCFVGARQSNLQCSGRFTDSNIAVIESCEFDNSFHHLAPEVAVLTGIERDHFDCFSDEATEDAAFRRFMAAVPNSGYFVVNADCSRSCKLVSEFQTPLSKFTMHNPNGKLESVHISDVSQNGLETRCVVHESSQAFELRLHALCRCIRVPVLSGEARIQRPPGAPYA